MSEQTTDIKPHLDRSVDMLKPEIEQKLNARRNIVMQQSHRRGFKLSYTLAPLALIFALWFGIMPEPGLTADEEALYEDIELLIVEGDLEFLDEMDVSNWLVEEEVTEA